MNGAGAETPHARIWDLNASRGRTFLVDTSCGSVRQEAGPGERQAVVGQSQLLDAGQVLVPELVAVAAHVSVVIPEHSAFLVAEGVPDTRTLSVGLPATSVDINNVYMTQNYADKSVKHDRLKAEVVKKTRLHCCLWQCCRLLWRLIAFTRLHYHVCHTLSKVYLKNKTLVLGFMSFTSHPQMSSLEKGPTVSTNAQFNSRIHYLICFISDLHDLPSI